MKIIITENKLYNTIYKYIDNFYDTSNIGQINPSTYMGNYWDENPLITEYFDKGEFEDEDMMLFTYIQKEYYDENMQSTMSFRNQSPILIVNYYGGFTEKFGKYWKEPMKQWFEDNYKLPVKTIVAD
jgi:hypothetical protein